MLVVTTNDIPGWEIRSRNAFAQIGAGFKSMFGDELQGMTVDRIADLSSDYATAQDSKSRVKLSAEIRLCDSSLARLLRLIRTDVPHAPSQTTLKAQRAANARWDRERAATG